MRQAGIIAAAGLHALEHHHSDLAHDHRRARHLAAALNGMASVRMDLGRVETNIIYFDVPERDAAEICQALNSTVRVLPVGPSSIRAVMHRDIDDELLQRAIDAFAEVLD